MTFTPPGPPRPVPLPAPPQPARSRWTHRVTAFSPVIAAAGVSAYVLAFNPNTNTLFPPCILKATTGFDCPGCGGTRAFHSLLTGDVVGALDHNVFTLVVVPALLYLIVRTVLASYDITLPWPRLRTAAAIGLVGLLAVFTVVRNIPGTPLYWFNSGSA